MEEKKIQTHITLTDSDIERHEAEKKSRKDRKKKDEVEEEVLSDVFDEEVTNKKKSKKRSINDLDSILKINKSLYQQINSQNKIIESNNKTIVSLGKF
jgi:hypothetical protein